MALLRRSSFWRDVNLRGSISDLRIVFQQAGRNRWRIGFAAAACTIAMFSVMWQEEARGLPPRPTVTYITSWPADRPMAEIIASNIANQKRKERLAAEQARREEEVRQIYKTIGRMSGMDVDAIERKAKAEQARQAAEPAGGRPPAP